MRVNKAIQRSILLLACVGMIIPRSCLFAQQPAGRVISDIALSPQGTFQGRVVDAAGQPVAGAKILMATNNTVVVETQTDQAGLFAVNSLRGGSYQLAVGNVEHYFILNPKEELMNSQ